MDFISDFLTKGDISIPIGQLILFLLINSLCLLLGKHKMGLLISYCFVLYWGFILNKEFFVSSFGSGTMGLTIYIVAGLVVFVSIVVGLFHKVD